MKTINLITGGSSGIGFECAKGFKGKGLYITGRDERKLESACEELMSLGVDAKYAVCDISDQAQLTELFERLAGEGELGCVLNSAGVSGVGVSGEKVFNIDLKGAKLVLNETLKHAGNKTVLILIASMMGHTVPPNADYDVYLTNPDTEGAYENLKTYMEDPNMAYNFCKRGNHLMVREYAGAFGAKGARIMSISPGIIMTPMAIKAAEAAKEVMERMLQMTPAGRNGKPEDISNAVQFLCSDQSGFITGTDLLVDGGLTTNLLRKK